MSKKVITGLEKLAEEDFCSFAGAKVGLLANQATVTSSLDHAADLMHASRHCQLTKLLAPEHGFRGVLQDMDTVKDEIDSRTKLPVFSLYGDSEESLCPKEELLEDLDILVVDLPDIGSRYYTFAQSLIFTMQTASKTGTKIIVLDRPNPLGGEKIEGGDLLATCRSFCGYAPVPQRHGLTLGEMAVLARKGFGRGDDAIPSIDCDLQVVELDRWKRTMYFDQTGLPWISPSVNMPTLDTALVFPGMCLFEATELSEGRGTTHPFEFVGAPFVDGFSWAEAMASLDLGLAGAKLRPISFLPQFQKLRGKVCGGLQVHVTNRDSFQPFRWSLALLHTVATLYPEDFSWRHQAYEFIDKVRAVDLLYGSDRLRTVVEDGGALPELFDELDTFESWYVEARKEFLLY